MTSEGGYGGGNTNSYGYGTVFSVGTNGTNYQNLVSFTGTSGTANGSLPNGSLVLSGTTLYGMTAYGGVHGDGNIFSVGINGSGYQDLYDFTGGADGADPEGDLLASGGTLFGLTSAGGVNGDGTVFALVVPEPGTLARSVPARLRCFRIAGGGCAGTESTCHVASRADQSSLRDETHARMRLSPWAEATRLPS